MFLSMCPPFRTSGGYFRRVCPGPDGTSNAGKVPVFILQWYTCQDWSYAYRDMLIWCSHACPTFSPPSESTFKECVPAPPISLWQGMWRFYITVIYMSGMNCPCDVPIYLPPFADHLKVLSESVFRPRRHLDYGEWGSFILQWYTCQGCFNAYMDMLIWCSYLCATFPGPSESTYAYRDMSIWCSFLCAPFPDHLRVPSESVSRPRRHSDFGEKGGFYITVIYMSGMILCI
jgi:hypothetical protein